jgi:hypothetical protein
MNKEEFVAFHRGCIELMHEIMLAKNRDYTGDSTDPFANFTLVEAARVCKPETGFLVRMTDKMSRIATLLDGRKAAVTNESIKDTLLDLANYSILLAGYLESKEQERVAAEYQPYETRTTSVATVQGVAMLNKD